MRTPIARPLLRQGSSGDVQQRGAVTTAHSARGHGAAPVSRLVRTRRRLAFAAVITALGACSGSSDPGTGGNDDAGPTGCAAGAACPTGEVCDVSANECISACAEPRVTCDDQCCALGDVCEPMMGCIAPNACATVLCNGACCPAGNTCVDDQCSDVCAGQRCGSDCCGATETCLGDTCCATDRVCGSACCGDGESCVSGACVTLGALCDPAQVGCATRPDATGCPAGQICEPELGRCITDLSDPSCTFTPPVGEFDPVPLFTWGRRRVRECEDAADDCQTGEVCTDGECAVTWPHIEPGQDDLPEYFQVTSVPIVADLDGDCVPEIIFNTYSGSSFQQDGVLRAIRGDNGAKVWTASVAAYRTDSTANPAVGDVNGDGEVEIYVAAASKNVLAFDARGRPRWTSDTYDGPGDSGSITLANMDDAGAAEIIHGAVVYDADGGLLFEGLEGRGIGNIGPISCVADLDGDGRAELIAGRTVYAFTGVVADDTFEGSPRFSAPEGVPDGYCGIADFDGDDAPEIVLVASGTVYVLQGQTGAVLASQTIPGGGFGGAPNIADFDGDGQPDIGTAGASNYVVMRYGGAGMLSVVWSAPTEDDSSSRTGSSVFDFDGDGRAEVVYNDEEFVRIYPGLEPACRMSPPGPDCNGIMTDDEILFRDLNSSRTRTEYPVIADVDGDFKAEIVFATSNEANFLDPSLLGDAGIEVWRDRLDNWVGTPAIWNQHSFHITNVGIDGRIPQRESPSWSTPAGAPFNSYRRNAQGDRAAQCAPDLVVTDVRQRAARCPLLAVEVEISNRGCLGVGPGVDVALRTADGENLGLARTTEPFAAGGRTLVEVLVSGLGDSFRFNAVVEVDAEAALNECREQNNASSPVSVSCQSRL